jgi:hypothetical protein
MAKYKYTNTFVDPERLAKLKQEMDLENSPEKYHKYKMWLHYANLQSWQQQGWHWGYLNNSGREYHCTCGLVATINGASDLSESVQQSLLRFDLDKVQRVRGHRRLPKFKGLVVAIFVDFKWDEPSELYLWSAICQKCGEFVVEEIPSSATAFVNKHNKQCNRRLRGLGSWL